MNIRKIDSSHFFKQESDNLFDLVVPATATETNIHTFAEFKEWMAHSFHIKTQLNTSSYVKKNQIVNSLKLRQAKSLSNDIVNDPSQFLGSIKKTSINSNRLEQIIQGNQAMESSYQVGSRNRSRKQQRQQRHLQTELGLQYGFQLGQNSIIGSKSAHSSRSFNGYQQINQYQLKQRIGKGSFAEVYLGIDTESQNNQKYAIKILESKQIKKKFLLQKNSSALDFTQNNNSELESPTKKGKQSLASMFIKNQVAILKKMNHQYITKLYDVIVDDEKSKIFLVLQYCGNGFINQDKTDKGHYRRLLESECKRYYKQLSNALDYIHNVAKIAHRDIKPENILLSEYDEVKISDFGLGTHKMSGKKQSGTPLYMSPESLSHEGESSSQSGDIWALGVTLIVLLSGKHPQFQDNRIDVKKNLMSLKDISENCKNFITRCLQIDVSKRIKAEELILHPWLGGENPNVRNVFNYGISITKTDEQNIFSKLKRNQNVIKITID